MSRLPARAWLGSFGLHLLVLAGIGLGSWVLFIREEPTPPPVISMVASNTTVRPELPPPIETVEVLPPDDVEAQLVEAKWEPQELPEGESPLEMWPLPVDWLQEPTAYREPELPTNPLTRVETEPQPEEPPPSPVEPDIEPAPPGPEPAEPENAARVDPIPDPTASPQPNYPTAALRRGMEGVVTLLVTVDAEGRVTRVRVLESSGHGLLDRAAQDGVRKWRFTPATENGEAVPGAARVPIRFRLQQA